MYSFFIFRPRKGAFTYTNDCEQEKNYCLPDENLIIKLASVKCSPYF